MTLGDIIRHHRQLQGLSQPELASRAQIEQSYLSKLENDHSYPSDDILKRLMAALELDIARLCAQLDTQRTNPKVLHIESIRTYLARFEQRNQQRNITLIALFTLAIGIGVALFYVGHSKVFFPETLYSYVSEGEILPDEPLDYYDRGWARPYPSADTFDRNPQRQRAEIDKSLRVEPHTIQSFQPLENVFVRQLDNGNRRAYRIQGSPGKVPRAQNAWLMFIGIVLAVSAMIALMIVLRLGPARPLPDSKG